MTALIPLVLLPGLLCDADLWKNQIKYLKSQADCIVADTTQFDNLPAIAETVLRQAPPHFALAGLSMGGYVAFEIMRQAPERVSHLAVFDSSAREDTSEQKDRRRMLLALSKTGQFRGVTPRLLPLLLHPDHVSETQLTDVVTGMAERIGRDAFTRQQTAILNRIDSRPFLKDIRCPVLIGGGQQDQITPPEILQEMADLIPNARFKLIDQCGHLSPLEQPEIVNELMAEWLRT